MGAIFIGFGIGLGIGLSLCQCKHTMSAQWVSTLFDGLCYGNGKGVCMRNGAFTATETETDIQK